MFGMEQRSFKGKSFELLLLFFQRMASLLKYCHGFFGLNHKKIFIWSCMHVIVLAAVLEINYPQDLICHFCFMEKRDRFIKAITLFCISQHLYSYAFLVGRTSQVIFVDGAVSAERILILRTCKRICVDRNRRPAMTFFEKSKQAKQSKTEGTPLYSFGITRQGTPRHLSKSRHSMNLRNVKLFRAVMHDELEMSIYDLVFG